MGLLDTLLGRTKPVRPNLDALFSLPPAAVTLEAAAGLVLSGRAGVCWMPPAGRPAADVQREISELLQMPDDPTGAGLATAEGSSGAPEGTGTGAGTLTQAEDAFGYRWLLLDDADVQDLVNRVHLVNSLLAENGWGPQLLCSVFGVVPGSDADSTEHAFFLVYLFKRGTFYPFAPKGGQQRDSELELRIRSLVGSDLPVEQDLSRWFPMWDLPVH
ncbi:MAG: PspA-associated protein PspAB [Acidimicrobiales bacterium]